MISFRLNLGRVWLVLVLVVGMAGPGWAKVIYVDDDSLGGDGTSWETAFRFLQDAIAVSEANDEVRVAQGVYKPDRRTINSPGMKYGREASFLLKDNISMQGGFVGLGGLVPDECDAEKYLTVLSGDLNEDDPPGIDPSELKKLYVRRDNCFHVISVHGEAVIDGFWITGGHADGDLVNDPYQDRNGGGGHVTGPKLTIKNCRFEANVALNDGGGVYVEDGEISIENTVFQSNYCDSQGGALCIDSSYIQLSHCHFFKNVTGHDGGGVGVNQSNVELLDCMFECNVTQQKRGPFYGGGIKMFNSVVHLSSCTFLGNEAECGGAIEGHGASDTLDMEDCHFVANVSVREGGAIRFSGDVFTARNCLFYGNSTSTKGGAVYDKSLNLEIINCTSVGNRASEGRFLARYGPHGEISSCILWDGGYELCGQPMKVQNSCVQYAQDGHYTHAPWPLRIGNNISLDPCFADPGYWDTNNTPNNMSDDHFVVGDYHLKSQAGRWDPMLQSWIQDKVTSPCIDAGDPDLPIGNEFFPNGGIINMGAYGGAVEASKSYFGSPPCGDIVAGDINGDCRVDLRDLQILTKHWLESR